MNRESAIERILQCRAILFDSASQEGEKKNALEVQARLKKKFALQEEDITKAMYSKMKDNGTITEDTTQGPDLEFFQRFHQKIKPSGGLTSILGDLARKVVGTYAEMEEGEGLTEFSERFANRVKQDLRERFKNEGE